MAEMYASTVVGKYVTLELLQIPAEHFTVRGPDLPYMNKMLFLTVNVFF